MKRNILIITILLLLIATPLCNVGYAANYERAFKLLNHPGGDIRYSLMLSITPSLYNYYRLKNHDLSSSADFAKFVTPYPVEPIADALWEVYTDAEVFADAVLGMCHQITYEVSPEVYPVETLVLEKGDCGGFSFLAASIMKAGGLDVVLFEYQSKQHLNVGVHLPHKPTYVRGGNVYYVMYNSKTYYVAECTGDSFPNGWRVGECPQDLKSINPNVIEIDGYESTAPGQVSASYKTLNPSQISISASSFFAVDNSAIAISGMVSPSVTGNVTIYVSSIGTDWTKLTTVPVNEDGMYSYQWNPRSGGMYYLEASWSGNEDYAGADSPVVTVFVVPFYGLVAMMLGIMMLILIAVFWLIGRRGRTAVPTEPPILETSEPPASPPPTSLPPAEETPQPQQEETLPPSEGAQQPSEEPQTSTSHNENETTPAEEPQPSSQESPSTSQETQTPPPATTEPTPPEPQPSQEQQQPQEQQPQEPQAQEQYPTEPSAGEEPQQVPYDNPP